MGVRQGKKRLPQLAIIMGASACKQWQSGAQGHHTWRHCNLVQTLCNAMLCCNMQIICVVVTLQALGVTVDMTSRTMGVRTRRFAMYVDDGEVCFLYSDNKSNVFAARRHHRTL